MIAGELLRQAQVGDIGLMGGPAKLDGKAVEGVRIMVRTAASLEPCIMPGYTQPQAITRLQTLDSPIGFVSFRFVSKAPSATTLPCTSSASLQ